MSGWKCRARRRLSARCLRFFCHINRPGNAHFLRQRQSVFINVGDHHIARANVIFDPFGNAVHTALSFDLVGEDVLISGAGPIGIMADLLLPH
jgi:threonine 3-dehydrogenase